MDRRRFLKTTALTAGISGLAVSACENDPSASSSACSTAYLQADTNKRLRYKITAAEQRDGLQESQLDLIFPPGDIRRYYPAN